MNSVKTDKSDEHKRLQILRMVGLIEGVSYLILLGIAMPLKYFAGIPEAVKVVGWAHGVLFMAYLAAMGWAQLKRHWGLLKLAWVFVASLLPFGTFVLDKQLKAEQATL